ncbi:hypothetical protein F5Y15DRAFT_406316 [Xylariaceae sp. FL0016]|nr:hypothetical protein F5Y15DRAFT_406316 [Xylariaceae sp. FL0016]
MMVDTHDEMVVPPAQNETDQLAEIKPDQLDNGTEQESDINAAEDGPREAMKKIVLPPLLEEPKVLEDVYSDWQVEGWSTLEKKKHGDIFQTGSDENGDKELWRILLFPFGNNIKGYSSIYLEHVFDETKSIPEDWSCCVQFSLVMYNTDNPTSKFHHTAHHRFTKEESDWGFTRFLEHNRMFQPTKQWDRPLVENDRVTLTAYVRVLEDETGVLWHNFNNYDSKKETGYVGLKNQGATCYLNSLLQSLYFTNAFRKAVYQIPTAEDESTANSAYSLQRLFYQLQISSAAVSTNDLTKSFGWEQNHVFEQQDVQELSRKLIERMEERMKGTAAEDALPKMLSGKVKTYVSCINVDYESSRLEDFWDIQLNVRGIPNLQESFKDYIQQETLDGDNKYWAGDDHKYQDARKGVIFTSFPEVLHLHLKRFEYDIQRDTMMKINDRFEFPETLDLEPYLEKDADRSEPWTYKLHGVLVHSGDLNAGHYYAFLKPKKDGWFYKFDDDKVTKATIRETLEENFGGEYKNSFVQARTAFAKATPVMRQMNAYMLVYIRESRQANVLTPVTEEDCPPYLPRRLQEEAAAREARRKEREEQHLYLGVKVITDHTFKNHRSFDLTDFDSTSRFSAPPIYHKMKRQATMKELVETIAENDLERDPVNGNPRPVDPRRVRLWLMVNRQNKTTRPDQPVMDLRPTVEEIFSRSAGTSRDHSLRVWAEVAEEVDSHGDAIWPTYQSNANGVVVKNDLILLFLKHYYLRQPSSVDGSAVDTTKMEPVLEGAGHVYVSKEKRVEEIVPTIAKRMGWGDKLSAGEQLAMWEEIKPNMIEILKAKQTLKAAELQDGDIVCFQKLTDRKSSGEILGKIPRLGDKNSGDVRRWNHYPDAKSYYDDLPYRREIRFDPHPDFAARLMEAGKSTLQSFLLKLSTRMTYDDLSQEVADELTSQSWGQLEQELGKTGLSDEEKSSAEVKPTHLRFFTATSAGTARGAVKRSPNANMTQNTLGQILNPNNFSQQNMVRPDALFFEILDMTLAQYSTMKTVKVTLLSEAKDTTYDVLVSKQGHVEDLVQALAKVAKIKDEREGGRIRIYETQRRKHHRDLPPNYPVISINDYTDVVAERVPEEELDADERDFIKVVHFYNEPTRLHGVPFKFLLKEGEPFAETKKRLEKRTGLKGKSFEIIKFALLGSYSKPRYINDDTVLFEEGGTIEEDITLGLDHPDRHRSARNGNQEMFLR